MSATDRNATGGTATDRDLELLLALADETERAAAGIVVGEPTPVLAAASRSSTPAPGSRLVLAGFALAACTLVLLLGALVWSRIAPSVSEEEAPQAPAVVAAGCQLQMCVDPPSQASVVDGVRSLQLELTAEEDVVAVAILHGWDDDCQCIRSQLHELQAEDGSFSRQSSLLAGIAVSFGVEVAAAARGERRLLVLAARDPSELPGSDSAADTLLNCMRGLASTDSEAELSFAGSTCLAPTICLSSIVID